MSKTEGRTLGEFCGDEVDVHALLPHNLLRELVVLPLAQDDLDRLLLGHSSAALGERLGEGGEERGGCRSEMT